MGISKTFCVWHYGRKTSKLLNPIGRKPGVMCSSCKVDKTSIDNYLPICPILLTLNIPTYKLAIFLVQILKHLATGEFTVKKSSHFVEKIVNQQPDFSMGIVIKEFRNSHLYDYQNKKLLH